MPPKIDEDRMHMRLQMFVLVGMTVLGVYLCWGLLKPFVSVLTWATSLVVLFMPLQLWLERRLKHPNLAALVSVIAIGLIVLTLATFVGQRLVSQVTSGTVLIESKVTSGEWRKSLENQPYLAPIIVEIEQEINLPEVVKAIGSWLTTTAGSIVKGSVYQLIGFCLTFYFLFFFLRDRSVTLKAIRSISPLSLIETNHIFDRIRDTIYATIYGTITVSSVQGLLGGLMFWWLGLSAALFWGVLMAILAVVPMLGAFVVWVPTVLFLAVEGSWYKAIILTLWGIFVVGTIDNLLRPVLVGNRLKLHTVQVFISVIGGLIFFGPAGLILGPVTFTVTVELLKICSDRFSHNKMKFIDLTKSNV